jgi:hypothetical protein
MEIHHIGAGFATVGEFWRAVLCGKEASSKFIRTGAQPAVELDAVIECANIGRDGTG